MMTSPSALAFSFLGQTLLLLPQKCMFWKDEQILLVADVHLGKVGHFRKAGIGIPRLMEQEDLAVLSDVIHEYQPKKLVFLGDLFHSELNQDWEWLVLWRDLFPQLSITLVRGNHDILHDQFYHAARFELVEELAQHPFLFSHEPSNKEADLYVISGHIHPGVRLFGKGRQSVTLPCFFFGKRQAILPAFGKFTGHVSLKYSPEDHIFGIMKHRVLEL